MNNIIRNDDEKLKRCEKAQNLLCVYYFICCFVSINRYVIDVFVVKFVCTLGSIENERIIIKTKCVNINMCFVKNIDAISHILSYFHASHF